MTNKCSLSYLFSIITLSLNTILGYAQSSSGVTVTSKTIGINNITSKNIQALEYIFPERIDSYDIDTTRNYLLAKLRGVRKNGKVLNNTGRIILFDLKKQQLNWNQKLDYSLYSTITSGKMIFNASDEKSILIDFNTGKESWTVNNTIYNLNPNVNIGLGYKYKISSNNKNILEGLDLTTKKAIWEREINRDYTWTNLHKLNDTTLLIVSSGLHTVNIKNGKGWDYNAVTGAKYYSGKGKINILGLALYGLTGFYVPYPQIFNGSTGYDIIRSVNSNVLFDKSNLYFASKDSLVRLNQNGNIIWQKKLPVDSVSNSSLFLKGDTLFMINKGYALLKSNTIECGEPFIAAFDINSGQKLFLSLINHSDEVDPIRDYSLNGDIISLILEDRLFKFSLKDGGKLMEKILNIKESEELEHFANESTYIKSNTEISPITGIHKNSDNEYLLTKAGNLLEVDKTGTISKQFDHNLLYFSLFKFNGLNFLNNNLETIVINKQNQIIAELPISKNATIIGSKIYDNQDKTLLEIALTSFMKN